MPIKIQCETALQDMTAFLAHRGVELAVLGDEASKELMLWVHYFEKTHGDSSAVTLLNGTRSALIETIGYISFGLGRAAINSIRTEIDLILSFAYFCDHPREWEVVISSGSGFMLRNDIYKYFIGLNIGFTENLKMVETATQVSLIDLYKILSAHIHAQSSYTIPKGNKIRNLVVKDEIVESIVQLQRSVSIALSNFFVTIYCQKWPELPAVAVKRVRSALSQNAAKIMFP